MQELVYRGWYGADRQEEHLPEEVVELKDHQQQEMEGKLQLPSLLTLVECTSSSLKGLYVGKLCLR